MSRRILVAVILAAQLALVEIAAGAPALQLFASSSSSELARGSTVAITLSLYATAPAGALVTLSSDPMPEGLQLVATRASGGSWVADRWSGDVALDKPITLELEIAAAPTMLLSRKPREICYTARIDQQSSVRACVPVRVDGRTFVFVPLLLG